MSDGTEVRFSDLRHLSSVLHDAHTEIDGILSTLRSDVILLLGAWQGEAADAFDAAYRDWTNQFTPENDWVEQASTSISGIAERYETTEDQVVQRAS